MRLVELECQNCGAGLKIDKDSDTISCPYCKATYKIDDETKKTMNSGVDYSKYLVLIIPFVIIVVISVVTFVGIGLTAGFIGAKEVSNQVENFNDDNFDEQVRKQEEKMQKEQDEMLRKYQEELKKTEEEEKKNNLKTEASIFNMSYSNGNKASVFVESMLNKVITNNKTNKERIITVKFKDIVTQDPDQILQIEKQLETYGKYDVLLDYDEDGFVNVLNIK